MKSHSDEVFILDLHIPYDVAVFSITINYKISMDAAFQLHGNNIII